MQKINHINQYLLERYPNIWNTRITWMLLLGFAIHLIFFFIGFVSHASPSTLQHSRAVDDYFSSGLIFVHVIISVLMLVGWVVFMFKNNGFKSFYPSSSRKLFFEFSQYFIIIFVSTTFYFSYMTGFKLFINYKYNDEKMEKNIALINRANPFLSQDLENYTLENRLYPKEFFDYYCETNINKIDKTKKYFVYHNRVYQYFSLYNKVITEKGKNGEFIYPQEEKQKRTPLAYSEDSNDGKSRTYYFKKQVEDLSPYIKSSAPSFYNFSSVFYDYKNNASSDVLKYRYDNDITNVEDISHFKNQGRLINQETAKILDTGNSKELEKLLQDFLNVSREFDISNNLNAKDWAAMVYHPDKFEVKQFIKKYKPNTGERYDPNKSADGYYREAAVDSVAVTNSYLDNNGEVKKDTVNVRDFNPNVDNEVSPEDFFEKNITEFYYYTSDLKTLLENIDTIKSNDFLSVTIQFYIWIAFSLAAFIFSFRVTNLRSLLFSIISAGVIILAVAMFCFVLTFVLDFSSSFFTFYTMFFVGCLILLMPFITIKRVSKLISSIFMIISINVFPLFLLLILGIINEHQTSECRQRNSMGDVYVKCTGILDDWGTATSYVIFICSFLFIYFYTIFIKKWKALPE